MTENKKPTHKRVMIKIIEIKENDVYGTDGIYIYKRSYKGFEEPKNSDNYVLKECWDLLKPSQYLFKIPHLNKNIKELLK